MDALEGLEARTDEPGRARADAGRAGGPAPARPVEPPRGGGAPGARGRCAPVREHSGRSRGPRVPAHETIGCSSRARRWGARSGRTASGSGDRPPGTPSARTPSRATRKRCAPRPSPARAGSASAAARSPCCSCAAKGRTRTAIPPRARPPRRDGGSRAPRPRRPRRRPDLGRLSLVSRLAWMDAGFRLDPQGGTGASAFQDIRGVDQRSYYSFRTDRPRFSAGVEAAGRRSFLGGAHDLRARRRLSPLGGRDRAVLARQRRAGARAGRRLLPRVPLDRLRDPLPRSVRALGGRRFGPTPRTPRAGAGSP